MRTLVCACACALLLTASVAEAKEKGRWREGGKGYRYDRVVDGQGWYPTGGAWYPRPVRPVYVVERRLPPGLQKKLARTGSLPPGWQKRVHPGYYHPGYHHSGAVYRPAYPPVYRTRPGVVIDARIVF